MNNISPLAYIHPEAKIGDNNIIGPFCYIDKNTVIGDNNVLQNNVTINYGARIGNNNEIFPGASISTKPQDLKFKGEDTTCEVGDNNSIRENVTISRGTASKGTTKVGSNNLLMETCMLLTIVLSVMDVLLETQQSLQEKLLLTTMPLLVQLFYATNSAILVAM